MQHAHGGEPEGGEPLLGDRADAPQLAHRQLAQAPVHVDLGELADAGRLVEIGSQLGEQSGGTDADGAGDPVLAIDLLLDTAGDGPRRTEETAAAGDLEKSLVDRDALDGIGELPYSSTSRLLTAA